jgi:hypothetical protein
MIWYNIILRKNGGNKRDELSKMWVKLYSKKWNKFITFGVLIHPKQKYKCGECIKQFVLIPQNHISEDKKEIIDK